VAVAELNRVGCGFCWCARLVEQGKLDEAEVEKQRVEQLQREQRQQREDDNVEYSPMWFT